VIGTLTPKNPILIPPDDFLTHQDVVREVTIECPAKRVVIDTMVGAALSYVRPIEVDPYDLPGSVCRQESRVVPSKIQRPWD
jgi:hypothetical protein